ncbi:uncharacterized protein DNG_10042 [Cephalotrichum gorgonifer]|uniref:DUF676 domain-containing protein n=1 Tax=Cephalotrichum gorgonifer TaxID=2041049 RepID=A0AAE8SZZ1_9PEZI|nr:uncharacterized protein DNG_10042 [Cephalotrichum gorgonifer]
MEKLKGLKKRLLSSKRASDENGPGEPSKESQPHQFESESHGLFVLHPPPEVDGDVLQAEVDIVAVHGLNGTARKTWRDPASGKLWLEDFLPATIPNVRVMTYGYDSGLAFSRSKAGIENFALDLLNRLRMMRTSEKEEDRPLIFVAHSLGGIVVKKALILANEAAVYYGRILNSTTGVIFMGTPHQGSELVPWAILASNIVNAAFSGQVLRTDLIETLKTGSGILAEISRAFVHRSTGLNIMSFIETEVELPLTTLVVPEYSARLNLPNEIVFPVKAHHRNICRYPNSRDQTYALVEQAIREVISYEPPTVNLALQRSVEKLTARSGRGTSSTLPSEKFSFSRDDAAAAEVSNADTANILLVRVSGLVRKLLASKGHSRTYSTVLQLPADTPVEDLKARILESEPDALANFETLRFSWAGYSISSRWVDVETAAVKVTTGNPCYNPIQGYKINRDQTIASFFSRAFPSPVQIQLRKHMAAKDSGYTPSYTISFGQRKTMDGQVSLLRSAKVPEDGKEYEIPAGLGTLPIYDVRSFSGSLPVSMVAKGGVFVTMHDVEAMCFAFDAAPQRKYAARVYLGDINGISGVSLFDNAKSGSAMSKQDYVVIPDQAQLHGVSVKPGLVRQFVTTPVTSQPADDSLITDDSRSGQERMPGTEDSRTLGATIEGQMTGKDSSSGIQLHIIPQLNTNTMFAGSVENLIVESGWQDYDQPPDLAIRYDVLKTPKELGLEEGSFVHLKDLSKRLYSRKKVLNDLFAELSPRLESTDVLDLHTYAQCDVQITVNIRMEESTEAKRFDFHPSDTIDGIFTFLQQKYGAPGRVLYVRLPVANIPDLLVPITTWRDFTMLAVVQSGITYSARHDAKKAAILELDCILANPKDDCPPRCFCGIESFKDGRRDHDATRMFSVAAAGTISDICQQIEAIEGLPVRLFRRKPDGTGVEMRGPQPVFDTTGDSIKHEVPMFEILQAHPAGFEIKIHTEINTLRIYIDGLGHEAIVDAFGLRLSTAFAKQVFSEKSGIEPHRLVLTYKGREFQDDGIGVGGNIVQDITPDDSDRRLWDMANSKIVNIQILNTATFKSLTGLEPPPAPIRAEGGGTIAVAGVPSAQSRSGIGAEGAFDGLQGVHAWRTRPILRHDGVAALAERGEFADEYTPNGKLLATDEIITLDVDDTFPRLTSG